MTTITTIRTTFGYKLRTVQMDRTRASFSGATLDFYKINKIFF